MTPRRLRAPATDGGLLVQPPPAAVPGLVAAQAARWTTWDYDFQGRRASRLRDQARREVVALAGDFLRRHGLEAPPPVVGDAYGPDGWPLIVTGHQPELFHPGVWVKNFAAAAIARACGGRALNLIVDNDIPKAASIRVPIVEAGRLRTVGVDFDQWPGEVPYEDWTVGDEGLFATVADRVGSVLGGSVADPVLWDYWPRAVRRRTQVDSMGLILSLARRELEQSWGISNLEVPLGAVCQSDSFLWFAAHLLAQLPRYRDVHNTCLSEYRTAHRIRSRHHPVAALGSQDEWLEAPFWAWRAGQPRRRPLWARQRPRALELRIGGEDRILTTLPLTPEGQACCAVERLRELAEHSIRLRTRALTTTMFSRFLLGDLFLHGIGGAKYDELGDEIARRFFRCEPPGFLTISLTLHLGLPTGPATPEELASVTRQLRDLRFNPDRYLSEPLPHAVRTLIRERRAAIAGPVTSSRQRIARAKAIRHLNESLQAWLEPLRADLQARQAGLRAGLRSNRVARNREFAYVLHSTRRLREAMTDGCEAFGPADRSGNPQAR
jgi:hypothetical protein